MFYGIMLTLNVFGFFLNAALDNPIAAIACLIGTAACLVGVAARRTHG